VTAAWQCQAQLFHTAVVVDTYRAYERALTSKVSLDMHANKLFKQAGHSTSHAGETLTPSCWKVEATLQKSMDRQKKTLQYVKELKSGNTCSHTQTARKQALLGGLTATVIATPLCALQTVQHCTPKSALPPADLCWELHMVV